MTTGELDIELLSLCSPRLRKLSEKALRGGDLVKYLSYVEPQDQWRAMMRVATLQNSSKSWQHRALLACFTTAWTWLEHAPTEEEVFHVLSCLESIPVTFTPEDAQTFQALTEPFWIYRGYRIKERGRSWTLSPEIARHFAKLDYGQGGEPRVIERLVGKDQVLFYSNVRQEQEIVLREPLGAEERRVYGSL